MYDTGSLMKLPASMEALRDRAVPHHFVRGEYVVKVETTNTTMGRFPIHSARFTLNTQEELYYKGSKCAEDGHRVHFQTAYPVPAPINREDRARYRPRQIYGVYFLNNGGKTKASYTDAPWSLAKNRLRTSHLSTGNQHRPMRRPWRNCDA